MSVFKSPSSEEEVLLSIPADEPSTASDRDFGQPPLHTFEYVAAAGLSAPCTTKLW